MTRQALGVGSGTAGAFSLLSSRHYSRAASIHNLWFRRQQHVISDPITSIGITIVLVLQFTEGKNRTKGIHTLQPHLQLVSDKAKNRTYVPPKALNAKLTCLHDRASQEMWGANNLLAPPNKGQQNITTLLRRKADPALSPGIPRRSPQTASCPGPQSRTVTWKPRHLGPHPTNPILY